MSEPRDDDGLGWRPEYRPDWPPPMWAHPPWFYRVVAICVVILTIGVFDWLLRH